MTLETCAPLIATLPLEVSFTSVFPVVFISLMESAWHLFSYLSYMLMFCNVLF